MSHLPKQHQDDVSTSLAFNSELHSHTLKHWCIHTLQSVGFEMAGMMYVDGKIGMCSWYRIMYPWTTSEASWASWAIVECHCHPVKEEHIATWHGIQVKSAVLQRSNLLCSIVGDLHALITLEHTVRSQVQTALQSEPWDGPDVLDVIFFANRTAMLL